MISKAFLSLLLISFGLHVNAAKWEKITISFVPTFGGKEIVLEKQYYLPDGDSISFETFRCYITNIGFNKDNNATRNSYLLDAGNSASLAIDVMSDEKGNNTLHFNIGIDSATNVSGAMGGVLDPLNGMYWTWQSGYINFKLEGKSNRCPTRKNAFTFHVGGYANADNALQSLQLPVSQSSSIRIAIPIDKLIAGIDLSKQNSIMIPGKEAVDLAKQFANIFELID